MTENEVAKIIVDCAFKIHSTLGPGLYESVYHKLLEYELKKRGLRVQCEVRVPVVYDKITFDVGFEMDLLVEDLVIVELKSVDELHPVHKKQVLTYLKLSGKKLGLLINFGEPLIKDGIVRLVNGLKE